MRSTLEVRVLVRLLALAPYSPVAGREVVRELVAAGDVAVPVLEEALASPRTPRVARLAAAWILGCARGAGADRALALAERDPDADLAAAATSARARRRSRATSRSAA